MAIHPTPNLSLPSYHLDVSDLETLLMMVQNERVRLLDQQLAMQVDAVLARNNQVAHLNKAQTALNKAKQLFSADDKPDAKFKDTKINDKKDTAEHKAIVDEINKAFEDAGMSTRVSVSGLKKHEVESLIQETKAAIDEQTNSQQLDMLRLQALSSKRNESFDVMTNFVKKLHESRASIISNMR